MMTGRRLAAPKALRPSLSKQDGAAVDRKTRQCLFRWVYRSLLASSVFFFLTALVGLSTTFTLLETQTLLWRTTMTNQPHQKNHHPMLLDKVMGAHNSPLLFSSSWKVSHHQANHTQSDFSSLLSPNKSDTANSPVLSAPAISETPSSDRRFLVFKGTQAGQGAGNVVHGLLAAHLFGLEFNRTVCVTTWPAFFTAFDYATKEQAEICKGAERWRPHHSISMWNYIARRVDECALRDNLQSEKHRIVSFSGNTYPGWRSDIPPNLFHRYYKPKPALLKALPYQSPPKVVVHLRYPDGQSDQDRGLDKESLKALGYLLRGNGTYLVTNRADWYWNFHSLYGWSYDKEWVDRPIRHGALNVEWDSRGAVRNKKPKVSDKLGGRHRRKESSQANTTSNRTNATTVGLNASATNNTVDEDEQSIKLWSDWYTMLTAERVYHSNSDFSRSAVHWNAATTGYQLKGMIDVESFDDQTNATLKRRQLNLVPAPYDAVPTRIPPLVERQDPNSVHSDDACVYLRFCGRYDPSLRNQVQQLAIQRDRVERRQQERRGSFKNKLSRAFHLPHEAEDRRQREDWADKEPSLIRQSG